MPVTLLSLLLAGAGLCALLCLATAFAARSWSEWQHRDGEPGLSSLAFAMLCAGAIFVVLAVKLTTVARFAVDLPFWDQWEEAPLYSAFHRGGLTWGAMLSAHNEHRIFVSRVLALTLEAFNDQWDNRLQAVACALVHAFEAGTLLLLLGRTRRMLEAFALVVIVVGALAVPVARENVVWGFQSQFYLYVLFSVLGLGLVSESRAYSGAWWSGHFCVACTVLCLGSGIVTAAVALMVVLFRLAFRDARRNPAALLELAPSAAVVGVAALVMVRPAAGVVWQPRDIRELMVAFGRSAGFPWVDRPSSVVFLWSPWLVAGWRWMRRSRDARRSASSSGDREGVPAFIGLGAWVLANAAAIALARGVGGARPSSRYMDILATGVVINAWLLVRSPNCAWFWRSLQRLLAAGWIAFATVGMWGITRQHVADEMPAMYTMSVHQVANVRAFLASGDPSVLQGRAFLEIPYPSPEYLVEELRDAYVREILPSSLRERPQRGPCSRAAEALMESWRAILAVGVGAIAAALLVSLSSSRCQSRGRTAETRNCWPKNQPLKGSSAR